MRSFIEALESSGDACRKEAHVEGGEVYGYSVADSIPKELVRAAEKLSRPLGKARDSKDADTAAAAKEFYAKVAGLLRSAEFFDEGSVFFTELKGEELTVRAMCLDPSKILDRAMSGARSSILFSATLTPLEYFSDVTGCADAASIELESPYSPDNLAVAILDGISTKYMARKDTASEVAEAIIAAIGARSGHYIVYFPSYKYMQTVFDAFRIMAPKGVSALLQKPSMSLDARRKFLSFFENSDGETLVGFCVLGGVFSEGIDLPDDRLIGAILVGIGLPSLSSELNILKDYYDRTREGGFEFAYLYPALIKISQAAGRVIRDEKDRGAIVLIDERYRDPAIVKLLPPHWKNIHIVGDAASLSGYLTKFWEKG